MSDPELKRLDELIDDDKEPLEEMVADIVDMVELREGAGCTKMM